MILTDSYIKEYLLTNKNYCKLIHNRDNEDIQEIKQYLSERFYDTDVNNAWFRIINSYIGYCPINCSISCKSVEEYNEKDRNYQLQRNNGQIIL